MTEAIAELSDVDPAAFRERVLADYRPVVLRGLVHATFPNEALRKACADY